MDPFGYRTAKRALIAIWQVLYNKYYAEARLTNWRTLSKSYFNNLWHKIMRRGVVCPSTNVHFKTFIRTVKARGFSKCDICELLKAKIRNTTGADAKSSYSKLLQNHYNMVSADRRELARIARYAHPFTHTMSWGTWKCAGGPPWNMWASPCADAAVCGDGVIGWRRVVNCACKSRQQIFLPTSEDCPFPPICTSRWQTNGNYTAVVCSRWKS